MEISELKEGTCFTNYMETLSVRLWKVWKIYRFSDIFKSELEIESVTFQVIDLDSGEAFTANYKREALSRILMYSGEIDPKEFDKAMMLRGLYMSGLKSIAEGLKTEAANNGCDENK